VRRHASANEMASYAAGDMRPRKAAKIAAHLADCAACGRLLDELEDVSDVLAGVSLSFVAMPENLSTRVEAAIATESVRRVASEPGTEAGRRDVPVRSPRSTRLSWRLRLPSISPGALRTVSATAVAALVVGGAYELIAHAPGSSSGPAASAGAGQRALLGPRAAAPKAHAAPSSSLSFGPDVTLTSSSGREVNIRTASTSVNYVPQHMQTQVDSAMTQAKDDGLIKSNMTATNLPNGSAERDFNTPTDGATARRLAGCIERLAGTRVPVLVEQAKYEGVPATIIVLKAVASHPAEVLVVGVNCSAQLSDELAHHVLKHL
jgi:hypothetical protein